MAVLNLFGEAHAVIKPDIAIFIRTDTDGGMAEAGGFQVRKDGFHQPGAKTAAAVFLLNPERAQVGGAGTVREIPVTGDIPEDIQFTDQFSVQLQGPENRVS